MKKIILFLMLTASGISASNAQTDFPCTDDQLINNVTWLDFNIVAAGWPAAATLNVSVVPGFLRFDNSKRNAWPNHYNSIINASVVNANIWAVVQSGGQWYAVTWEWIVQGRTDKLIGSFDGGHMKRPPFSTGGQGGPNGWWEPKNGEVYGFMVSDFARFGTQIYATFKERSNVAWYKWGVGQVDVCAEQAPDTPVIGPILNGLLLDE